MWIKKERIKELEDEVRFLKDKIHELEWEKAYLRRFADLTMRHQYWPMVEGTHIVRSQDKESEVNFSECKVLFAFEYMYDKLYRPCNYELAAQPCVCLYKYCIAYFQTPTGRFVRVSRDLDYRRGFGVEICEVKEADCREDYLREYWGKQFVKDNAHFKREVL